MTVLPPDAAAIRHGKPLPKVYISGPYSRPDIEANLMRTARVCSALASTGLCFPYAPLLFCHAWEERVSQSYEFWIEYTKRMLVGCDALFRMPGDSDGADGEVALARELGLPVIISKGEDGGDDAVDLLWWLQEWHAGDRGQQWV